MKIIEAIVDDIEELAVMFDSYRIFYKKSSDINGAKNFLRDRIQNKESIIFLATDEMDHAHGFAQLYPLFSSTRMKKLWLLNDLFVIPDQRGKGIGRLLIERCKALAMETNASGLLLETEKSNVIGNHLYPATGFELDAEHNFYFWTNPV